MKFKYYIIGAVALSLCTACNNKEELEIDFSGKDEVQFNATLQNTTTITPRAIETLPYINGIHVLKIGSETVKAAYNVNSTNKGTLTVVSGETYLKWSTEEKGPDYTVHFYSWTTPTGVEVSQNDKDVAGTVNFSHEENGGNRAPKNKAHEETKNLLDTNPVTPLEVFISTYTSGKYRENPNICLPFKHQVCKVAIQIRSDKNEIITDNVTIDFPFIKKQWNIKQDEKGEFTFNQTTNGNNLSLKLDQLAKTGSGDNEYRLFYLPPMTGEYAFDKMGDFVISWNGNSYYGTLATRITTLKKGEYMTCRIDLNENYGTGVGAFIQPWVNGSTENTYVNPYRGIYTVEGLEVLKEYLISNEPDKKLPDSLYIDGTNTPGEKKIIRLYNDLDLTTFGDLSLVLKENMIFDGLGHTITVPETKSLFGDITATGIKINNISLSGAGTLANALTDVEVANCHANGTGNLVGTAHNGTIFNFCSAEAASSLLAGTTSGTVTIQNCFVAYDGATGLAGTGETVTAKNSFFFNTVSPGTGTYYDENGSSTGKAITVDTQTGQLVIASTEGYGQQTDKLIDLLNAGSNTLNSITDQKYWVYVYGKNYPVMRIK